MEQRILSLLLQFFVVIVYDTGSKKASNDLVEVGDDMSPIQSPAAAAAACGWDVCWLTRSKQEGSNRPDAQSTQ